MTIDEAISHAREKADKNSGCWKYCTDIKDCKTCEKEHEQLAEWLEELKEYKKKPEGYMWNEAERKGYNKAIDDFYNAIADDLIWIKERFGDDAYTNLWCDVGIRAEQLKESNKE